MQDFSAIRVEQVNLNGIPLFLRVTEPAGIKWDSHKAIMDNLRAFVESIGLDVPVLLLPDGWKADVVADEPLVTSPAHPQSTAMT